MSTCSCVRKTRKDETMNTVSIVTLAQGSPKRLAFLETQIDSVIAQAGEYPHIIEWIIVNGSKSVEDVLILDALIKDVIKTKMPTGINVVNVRPAKLGALKIGGLRNAANRVAKGDIIVTMDDDDYYHPQYVSHAVEKLAGSKAEVAGCCAVFVYDLRWKLLTQVDLKVKNHTSNNTIAYKRKYAETHKYDETVDFDEESSFLEMSANSFEAKATILQLDPMKCGVHMLHGDNTVDKARVSLSPLYEVPYCTKLVPTHVATIDTLVPAGVMKKYEAILGDKDQCKYDVVYYCGLWSIKWDPRDASLGGSEQAVVELSREWARMGLRVAVYGEVPDCIVNGVEYHPAGKFNPWQKFNTLILWRWYGMVPVLSAPWVLDAKRLFIDLHDNFPELYQKAYGIVQKYLHARIFFKSKFHLAEYERCIGRAPSSINQKNYAIIMNGIQTSLFQGGDKERNQRNQRSPFRFCYASCYTRGLERILACFWPVIKKMEPRAELHLYYGMNGVGAEYAQKLRTAISNTLGVCDHGRQSIELVAREKRMSTFQLYITDCPGEIDCISIRESLVAGCIPLLLNDGVFAERHGFHVEKQMPFDEVAKAVVTLMQDQERCEQLRKKLATSDTIINWSDVAKLWMERM